MATAENIKPSDRIAKVDGLFDESNRGQTAEAILRVLDPLVEERLGQLLNKFEKCPPDLGPLLELKAQIGEIWRIRRELQDAKKLGRHSQALLEGIMQTKLSAVR